MVSAEVKQMGAKSGREQSNVVEAWEFNVLLYFVWLA